MSDMSFIEEQDYTKKFDPLLFKKLVVHMRKQWKAMGFVAAIMAIIVITDVFFQLLTRHAIDKYILEGTYSASL